MEEKAFPDLKISSYEFLNEIGDRSVCPKCEKSRKYYCYNCYVPTTETQGRIPKVKLPLKIDIIKHPNECDGKSTSAHAAVLAPNHVNVYTYPCIPEYPDPDKVVLLFPGPDAITLEQLAERCQKVEQSQNMQHASGRNTDTSHIENISCASCTCEDSSPLTEQTTDLSSTTLQKSSSNSSQSTESCWSRNLSEDKGPHNKRKIEADSEEEAVKKKMKEDSEEETMKRRKIEEEDEEGVLKRRKVEAPFHTVVLIDSTWNQTKRISSDERLKGLTKVELKTRETKFWRHQRDNPATYLSTVEAVYYLVRDYHDLFVPTVYEGEYDNLLFFFCFMYEKIRKMYDGGKNLKAFKQRADMKKKHENK